MNLLFSKKDNDVFCEETEYVNCSFAKALEIAKKGHTEYKMLGASIRVLEC